MDRARGAVEKVGPGDGAERAEACGREDGRASQHVWVTLWSAFAPISRGLLAARD